MYIKNKRAKNRSLWDFRFYQFPGRDLTTKNDSLIQLMKKTTKRLKISLFTPYVFNLNKSYNEQCEMQVDI